MDAEASLEDSNEDQPKLEEPPKFAKRVPTTKPKGIMKKVGTIDGKNDKLDQVKSLFGGLLASAAAKEENKAESTVTYGTTSPLTGTQAKPITNHLNDEKDDDTGIRVESVSNLDSSQISQNALWTSNDKVNKSNVFLIEESSTDHIMLP